MSHDRAFVDAYRRCIRISEIPALQPIAVSLARRAARVARRDDWLAPENDTIELATLAFENGDRVVFEGSPLRGELTWHVSTKNRVSLASFLALGTSPAALYQALTSESVPMPWLITAVDDTPHHAQFSRGRPLTASVEGENGHPLELVGNLPQADPPPWLPDLPEGIDGYCGVSGQSEWSAKYCEPEWDPGPYQLPWKFNIYKCTSTLSQHITHESKEGSTWRRRRFTSALAAACTDPVRIRHQYRELGFFTWNWETGSDKVLRPGFTGSYWLGIVRRRRRVKYDRIAASLGLAGVRAFTTFEW